MAGCLLVLVIWQIVLAFRLVEPSLLPPPWSVVCALGHLVLGGDILPDLLHTTGRMALGYLSAGLVGVGVGLLIGLFRPLYAMFSGIIDFFRSIPVTTLYPVFVLLFGVGHLSKIGMVFWACFFVVALNSAYGAIQTSPVRRQMARLFGATEGQVFRWIVFFDALPQTIIGLRVALSYALIVEVLCEMFMGSQYGIGQRVTEAYTSYRMDTLYALTIVAGVFGLVLNRIFVVLERRVAVWVGK